MLVAFSALGVEWAVLKPIHDELVEKFRQGSRLKVERPGTCNRMNFGTNFKLVTFPFSAALVLLFAILSKRTAVGHRHLAYGHVAIPLPLDFFAHFKRTFSAVIFALYADELLDIATELVSGGTSEGDGGLLFTKCES